MLDEFADCIAGPSGIRDYDRALQLYATQEWSEQRGRLFEGTAVPPGSFTAQIVHHATDGAVLLTGEAASDLPGS
jgi:hypothetical protein